MLHDEFCLSVLFRHARNVYISNIGDSSKLENIFSSQETLIVFQLAGARHGGRRRTCQCTPCFTSVVLLLMILLSCTTSSVSSTCRGSLLWCISAVVVAVVAIRPTWWWWWWLAKVSMAAATTTTARSRPRVGRINIASSRNKIARDDNVAGELGHLVIKKSNMLTICGLVIDVLITVFKCVKHLMSDSRLFRTDESLNSNHTHKKKKKRGGWSL